MTTAKRLHYTYEEYLRSLEQSDIKLEYCDGVIYAMAGGSVAHASLGAAAIALLKRVLPPGCQVFTSDLKIRVESSDLSTFPDVSVVCGTVQTSSIDSQAVINPTLLVEVTSPSTEDYDRGDKLSHYKQLPSLKSVLFISHRSELVSVVSRSPSGWEPRDFRAGEVVEIAQMGVTFPVSEIYEGIALESRSIQTRRSHS